MLPDFPYQISDKSQIIRQINLLYKQGVPFLFILNYDGKNGFVIPVSELDPKFIQFNFNGIGFESDNQVHPFSVDYVQWDINPIPFAKYKSSFEYVTEQIQKGNSFLTNLTHPTPVKTNLTTESIFRLANSRYKLWVKDHFLVLSPEIFIQTDGDIIRSFPMKGTIDATLENAETIILNDIKEKAEHATIVDLIRNDLSMIADDVDVTNYRYVERIKTNKGELLQVSSEIQGKINEHYKGNPGEMFYALLPAGSITGAPKPKTMEIIAHAEGYDRGFYTGVCGYFDGANFDSAVMIRFLEEGPEGLIFKSGGGITSQSVLEKEYAELIQKVYVPVS